MTPRVNAGVTPRVNAGVTPRVNAGVTPRVNAGVTPRVNAGVTPRVNAGVTPRVNAGVDGNTRTTLRPVTPGVGANVNSGIRGNAGVGAGVNSGVRNQGDIRANVNAALNGRVNSPIRSNIAPGVNAGTGAAGRANLPGVGRVGVDGRVGTDGRIGVDGRGRNDGRVGVDGRVNGPNRVNNFLNGANVNARANLPGVNARTAIRPSWYNNNLGLNSRINANLGRTIGASLAGAATANYLNNNPNRNRHWGGYGNGVRNYWGNNRSPYFNNRWWAGHYVYRPYSYFNYGWGGRPYGYWWGSPGWVGVNRWYGGWGGWNSPYYYDYGVGGNVVYRDNYVYVDGTNVGTAEEYAQSAAALATVDPEEVPAQTSEDWLGLGTFALVETDDSGNKETIEPSRYVQLAVDKKGFVSGTLFNKKDDEVYSLSGRVDKDTQRISFLVDNDKDIVFETGLYNLTQDETPVLVHFGPKKSATFVFVRLEEPKQDATERGSIEQLP
ncbi:hypothetical protein NA78x_000879 [Anatilimnocola sp. NA78]|uniref:hypothetical protein n=1 Tax=Anatilimnocola sp. NA78 TaxID=3415683 RepID=UPI003CE4C743